MVSPPASHSKLPPAQEAHSASPAELARFALAAARRHWLLGLTVMLVAGGLGLLIVSVIPSVYESNAKIFDTQSGAITASVAGGRRDETTMRGIRETVFNRENLLSLVREAKLVERWEASRTWPFKLKDDLLEAMFEPPKLKDKERAMVDLLERGISVNSEEGSSIRFKVQWRDPKIAFELTQLIQRNFLEVRRRSEVEAITRGIALLEEERKRADAAIEPAIKEMQDMLAKAREKQKAQLAAELKAASATVAAKGPAGTSAAGKAGVAATAPPKIELTPRAPPPEVTERLEEIRRQQRNVLEPWQRHYAEAKFRLNELRVTYGPQHPSVRQQEARVDAASNPPPELQQLKQQEETLLASIAHYSTETVKAPPRVGGVGGAKVGSANELRAPLEPETEDPEVGATRVKLNAALDKARDVSDQLDRARMEIATANVSFKHRFVVVEAAEISRKPVKPRRELLYAAAIGVAVLLGLLVGAARELATGRVIEPWQVRSLGLDVLAEVNLQEPPGRPHP